MTSYNKAFLGWISSLTDVDDQTLQSYLNDQDLSLTLVTAGGTYKGKTSQPSDDSSIDRLGSLWKNTMTLPEMKYSGISSLNSVEANSIWLKDVTEINTNQHFDRLVMFTDKVIAVSINLK